MSNIAESRLTFIEKTKDGKALYKCGCGNVVEAKRSNVKRGATKSCGCLYKSTRVSAKRKHGLTSHPLYKVWAGMKSRCNNKNTDAFHRYGGRGVTVCSEWADDFMLFYKWAIENGWERGMEIDKDSIPLLKGEQPLVYSPDTCRVLTHRQNTNIREGCRLININGVIKSLAEWCRYYSISDRTARTRIVEGGMSEEDALTKPIRYKT